MSTSTQAQALLKAAWEMTAKAYAPYTNIGKGAAVQTADGNVYLGCNVELVSWSGSICAETAAVGAAAADGNLQIKRVAVVPFRYPCGVCLQLLREFGADIEIITEDAAGNLICKSLSELLPAGFTSANYR